MRRSDCSSRLLLQVIPPSFNSFKLFRVHFDFTRNTCWFCFTREQPVNHFFQQRQLIQRKPAKLAALRGGRKKSESRRGGREKEVFCAGSFGLKNSNLNVCNIIKTKNTCNDYFKFNLIDLYSIYCADCSKASFPPIPNSWPWTLKPLSKTNRWPLRWISWDWGVPPWTRQGGFLRAMGELSFRPCDRYRKLLIKYLTGLKTKDLFNKNQGKIKSMERERSESNASSAVTTPRLPTGELPIMKRFIARSRSQSTDATLTVSPSESQKTDSSGSKDNQSKGEFLTCSGPKGVLV